jgi:diguanylate cyclase (GGDEF)-like protein
VQQRAALRRRAARLVEARFEIIISQTVAVFPFAGAQAPDANDRARVCEAALRLLLSAVGTGGVNPRDTVVADLRRLAQDRSIGPQQLFGVMYLLERAAIDELAHDESTAHDPAIWEPLSQLVRAASCDALGAFAERLVQEPAAGALVDPLTTLHARTVFEAALDKEIQRAERFGHPFAVILFDVDRLGAINAAHGYGFGDRVLERIGILMRNYFREHDWVARWQEDAFVVLLPETQPEDARLLADRVRTTVEERMALRDYRTEERVAVTVSVAVLLAATIDADVEVADLMRLAEQGVHRAKHAGRNRVERVDVHARIARPPSAPPGTAPSALPRLTGPPE